MRWISLLLLLFCCYSHAAHLLPHLKPIPQFSQLQQIDHIDCIYIINLDMRPEKFEACKEQLDQYNIIPYRFSAVVGIEIPEYVMKDVGMRYGPGMAFCEGKILPGPGPFYFFNQRMYGKTCFYKEFTQGALGCTLSHLSILQHAYDSGYERIWVMEDDILLREDPHELSYYIEELSAWMGKENWDILYTDDMHFEVGFGNRWRPDYHKIAQEFLTEHPEYHEEYDSSTYPYHHPSQQIHSSWVKRLKKSGKNYGMTRTYPDVHPLFRYIISRYCTHSLILQRSGIKKILDFEKRYGIFLPYDNELSIIPSLKMFNLKSNSVTVTPRSISDTTVDVPKKQRNH